MHEDEHMAIEIVGLDDAVKKLRCGMRKTRKDQLGCVNSGDTTTVDYFALQTVLEFVSAERTNADAIRKIRDISQSLSFRGRFEPISEEEENESQQKDRPKKVQRRRVRKGRS